MKTILVFLLCISLKGLLCSGESWRYHPRQLQGEFTLVAYEDDPVKVRSYVPFLEYLNPYNWFNEGEAEEVEEEVEVQKPTQQEIDSVFVNLFKCLTFSQGRNDCKSIYNQAEKMIFGSPLPHDPIKPASSVLNKTQVLPQNDQVLNSTQAVPTAAPTVLQRSTVAEGLGGTPAIRQQTTANPSVSPGNNNVSQNVAANQNAPGNPSTPSTQNASISTINNTSTSGTNNAANVSSKGLAGNQNNQPPQSGSGNVLNNPSN